LLAGDQVGAVDTRATTTEHAVYADGTYRWRNGVSLGLGGRSYRTRLAFDADTVFLGRASGGNAATSEQGFTPKLSLEFRRGEQMAYLLVAKGYRFGGINFNPPAMTPYHSDSLWNHEAGLRLAAGKTLRIDLSAFFLDWKDAQVSALLAGPLPFSGVANVGRASSRGVEAALRWQPASDLALRAGLAYTDARTGAPFTSGSGALVASGTRLPGTARWQSTLQASYAFDAGAAWAGRASATHGYVGPRVFDIEAKSRAAGYSMLDLRVAFARGPWELSATVDNVFDSRGVGGAAAMYRSGLASYTDYYIVRPRSLGVALRYDL
jgi:outer membrane receptor protein involved in Fe transport